jgi:hypothetical protein
MGRKRKRYQYSVNIPDQCHDPAYFVRPPDVVLAEREWRLGLDLSLSQLLFGDPPLGYSALDRLRRSRRERRLRAGVYGGRHVGAL